MPSTLRKQEAHDYRLTLLLFNDKRLMATVEAALCIPLQLFRRLYLCVCFYLSNQLLEILTNLKSAWSYTDWSGPSGPENNDSRYPLLGVLVQVKAILDGHCLKQK